MRSRFVAAFLLQGAVRDGYRPRRHPVSSLALGPRGWIQTANFAVTGTLFLAGAAGLARAGDPAISCPAAPVLIGTAGAGLIGAAVFATDPVSGCPPGTPDALPEPSRTGTAHNLAASPVFFGLPAAALACSGRARRTGQRGFALYSAGTAITMLATMGAGRCGFWSITPAGQSRRPVPARQHHHRLRLAHRPVRTSTAPFACHRQHPDHRPEPRTRVPPGHTRT